MLFNCEHESCKNLNIRSISEESPEYLHRFMWCADDLVGDIDYRWNYLVGQYDSKDAKAVHFTEGGPWRKEWYNGELSELFKDYEYANEWLSYLTNDELKKIQGEIDD